MADTDIRERLADPIFRLVNPVVRRMLARGMPTGGPNVLLTVPGSSTGEPRTTPVGMLEVDGHRYVQAAFGEVAWVQNLRAAHHATLTVDGRRTAVSAVELPPDEGGAVLRSALQPFKRRRLLRWALGPTVRPPVGILQRFHIRIDETQEEYRTQARLHPLFELRSEGRRPD